VALTCQEDLDSLIQLIDSTRPTRTAFSIHLFKELPPISSANGVFIQSPETEMKVCYISYMMLCKVEKCAVLLTWRPMLAAAVTI